MLYENIKKLVQYGVETGLTPACEKNYTINLLLDVFKEDEYVEPEEEYRDIDLEEVLNALLDEAVKRNLIEDSVVYRDLFDTRLMNCLMPRPAQVQNEFWSRYEKLSLKLVNEMQIMEIKEELQRKVKNKVDKHQKEYLLREQLKVIREELGEDTTFSDADEFEEACSKLDAPEEVKEKLHKEIGRFKNTIGSQAENGVIRTYIETILEMP